MTNLPMMNSRPDAMAPGKISFHVVLASGRILKITANKAVITENEIIKASHKDTITEEWLFDRIENTDSAKYFIFQIGHSFENKFVTDAWLYVDSLTSNIYEYDLPNDSLILWRK